MASTEGITRSPFGAHIPSIAPAPAPAPAEIHEIERQSKEFADPRKQQPKTAIGHNSGVGQIFHDASAGADRLKAMAESMESRTADAQADFAKLQAFDRELQGLLAERRALDQEIDADPTNPLLEQRRAALIEEEQELFKGRAAHYEQMGRHLAEMDEQTGQSSQEIDRFLSSIKSAQLAVPEGDPRHEQLADAYEQGLSIKHGTAQLMKLFGDKIQLTNNAIANTTKEWKQSIQLVRDLQRFKVLLQEFGEKDKFSYADPSKFQGVEREKVEELNKLHDKLQASGLVSWEKKGWDKKEEYQTLKSNIGAAEKIALADREEMQVELQQLMTSYSNAIMAQASVQKMLADLVKFIIRSMAN